MKFIEYTEVYTSDGYSEVIIATFSNEKSAKEYIDRHVKLNSQSMHNTRNVNITINTRNVNITIYESIDDYNNNLQEIKKQLLEKLTPLEKKALGLWD